MFKFNGPDEEEFRNRLNKMIKDPVLLNELGDVMIKDIKFTARKGVNPITGGKFIPLSKKWIAEREKISQSTPVNDAFKPARSNVTLSGQLLDALRRSATNGILSIFFDGIHRPYRAKYSEMRKKQATTRQIGKPIPNNELAQYVNEIRPFFYVREKLLPQLKTVVIRYIRRNL
ncbi:MAG TPA: hypothetical protein PK522_00910 [Nitrosomonas sp.]|nr:hypothetical protein [Nitrosomonas sp.]